MLVRLPLPSQAASLLEGPWLGSLQPQQWKSTRLANRKVGPSHPAGKLYTHTHTHTHAQACKSDYKRYFFGTEAVHVQQCADEGVGMYPSAHDSNKAHMF